LVARGFSEVITSSFVKKDEIQLRNALASDKSYLRSSLRSNLTQVLDKNANLTDLLGANDTRVFEIGTVFTRVEGLVAEHVSLALGMRSRAQGYVPKDDALLREEITSLQEIIGDTTWNIDRGVAECDLSAALCVLPMPDAYTDVELSDEIVYAPFSIYPAMSRDIALWVSEGTNEAEVEDVLNTHAGALRVRTTLFDTFTKEGKTSYAFRLVFQSHDRTLTDAEVNAIMEGVYAEVNERGWEVR
jgi:phenylalanyl-tRNA synthetase beta subunit